MNRWIKKMCSPLSLPKFEIFLYKQYKKGTKSLTEIEFE